MVDRQDLARPAPELSEDGIPAIDEIPEEVLLTGDTLDGELPPLDRPQAVTGWGTTVAEQLGDEPLSVGARREEPEVGMPEGDGGDLPAEEAAMRVVDEPGGMNYDPDPGYVDHEGA